MHMETICDGESLMSSPMTAHPASPETKCACRQRSALDIELPVIEVFTACIDCECPANREHTNTSRTKRPDHAITRIYCDHCSLGVEVLWVLRRGSWTYDSAIRHEGADAETFRKHLEASVVC